ncbi:hypothetical protein B0H14DRAFT_3432372 [Mycena olivaceomarginata]|nr:hypothetical protein B0H14DRAFT_3432372 [Mycena olivaceomarginata]
MDRTRFDNWKKNIGRTALWWPPGEAEPVGELVRAGGAAAVASRQRMGMGLGLRGIRWEWEWAWVDVDGATEGKLGMKAGGGSDSKARRDEDGDGPCIGWARWLDWTACPALYRAGRSAFSPHQLDPCPACALHTYFDFADIARYTHILHAPLRIDASSTWAPTTPRPRHLLLSSHPQCRLPLCVSAVIDSELPPPAPPASARAPTVVTRASMATNGLDYDLDPEVDIDVFGGADPGMCAEAGPSIATNADVDDDAEPELDIDAFDVCLRQRPPVGWEAFVPHPPLADSEMKDGAMPADRASRAAWCSDRRFPRWRGSAAVRVGEGDVDELGDAGGDNGRLVGSRGGGAEERCRMERRMRGPRRCLDDGLALAWIKDPSPVHDVRGHLKLATTEMVLTYARTALAGRRRRTRICTTGLRSHLDVIRERILKLAALARQYCFPPTPSVFVFANRRCRYRAAGGHYARGAAYRFPTFLSRICRVWVEAYDRRPQKEGRTPGGA